MGTPPEREAALRRGDELWARLRRVLDARLHSPLGPETDWTGHDVYAHFARWQADAAEQLRRHLAGQPQLTPEADEEALNMRWRAEDRALPTEVVRERCIATRNDLRDALLHLDTEQWRRFGRFAAADIDGEHYEHHLAACEREAAV
jgi:hypothetical protein